MLLAGLVIALVLATISPSLNSFSVLQVILPVAVVLGTVYMGVYTLAIGFVIYPVSFIDITIYVPENTLTMSSVVLPLTFILCTIWPNLCSVAVSKSSNPLSSVSSSVFEFIGRSSFSLSAWIVLSALRNSFSRFFKSEVLAFVLFIIQICLLLVDFECKCTLFE